MLKYFKLCREFLCQEGLSFVEILMLLIRPGLDNNEIKVECVLNLNGHLTNPQHMPHSSLK